MINHRLQKEKIPHQENPEGQSRPDQQKKKPTQNLTMDSREEANRISPSLTGEPKRNSTEEAGNMRNTQTATTLEKAATGSTEEDEAKPKTKKTTIDFREGCMQRDHPPRVKTTREPPT